jgi:hypothetical protein
MDLPQNTAITNYFQSETTQEETQFPVNNECFRLDTGFSIKAHNPSYSVLRTFYTKTSTLFWFGISSTYFMM